MTENRFVPRWLTEEEINFGGYQSTVLVEFAFKMKPGIGREVPESLEFAGKGSLGGGCDADTVAIGSESRLRSGFEAIVDDSDARELAIPIVSQGDFLGGDDVGVPIGRAGDTHEDSDLRQRLQRLTVSRLGALAGDFPTGIGRGFDLLSGDFE